MVSTICFVVEIEMTSSCLSHGEPTLGLTEQECHLVEHEALRLMVLDRAICVAHQVDEARGASIMIFCEQGQAHVVGRCSDAYYVLDPEQSPLMVSSSFGRLLNMVRSLGQPDAISATETGQ